MGVPGTPRASRESWLEFQEELRDTIKGWCLHSDTMVTREGQGVTGGGEEKPLSAVSCCKYLHYVKISKT